MQEVIKLKLNLKNKLIWIVGIFAASFYLFLFPAKIETDILQLVSDQRFELVSKSFKNNILRFVFVGNNTDAAFDFKNNLPSPLTLKASTDYEKFINPAYLLSEQQQKTFTGSVEQLSQQILAKLSSPLSSFYSQFIEIDPLLQLPDRILEINKKLGFRIQEDILVDSDNTALIIAEMPKNFSRRAQEEIISKIEVQLSNLRSKYPETEIRWSGMLRFSNSSAKKMERDLNLISTTASILTSLIVFYCFRSVYPFLLCLLVVLAGILGGTFVVAAAKGSLHLLTLGFGCSLLGACVDYPIHFFCAKYFEENRNVIKPITFGALSTLLSFSVLLFSGFNGLVEISLFAIGSVFASWATVYCIFPAFNFRAKNKDPFFKFSQVLSFWTKKYGTKLYPLLCLICVIGALSFRYNDDIRLLQPADAALVADEKWVQEKTNFGIPSGFVFVSGSDPTDLDYNLQKTTSLLKHLQKTGRLDRVEGKYTILPSMEEQEQSVSLYRFFVESHETELRAALDKIGYEKRLIDQIFEIGRPIEFYPKEFDLGEHQGKFWSFLQVYGAKEPQSLRGVFEEHGFFYDQVYEISKIFQNYRERSFYLIVISYFLIFSLFCLRYGVHVGSRNFMPTIFSALLSLSFLALFGVQFNFFGLLALVIVLGLTIDYSIFYLEGESKIIPSSILLSSITTITTFGLLGLSSTPVLANFGILVAVGIFFATFLTYLPFCED